MAVERVNDGDLVLSQWQQVSVQDNTKGFISVYVGPTKTSLSSTDQLVIFNPTTRTFDAVERSAMAKAISTWPYVPEGSYVILSNPAGSDKEEHPKSGSAQISIELKSGKKINIHGPITFPLWPGQIANVISGHKLRTNEYLIVEIINEEEARANWAKSVFKKRVDRREADKQGDEETQEVLQNDTANLTMGQRLVIKGTDVSFYMPPTGVEVVPESGGNYIRKAVTLERLEYCILLSEDGNKRFVQGPAVVFPSATEVFVVQNGESKFRAIELTPISGIHLKVIAAFTDEKGVQRKVGEELFITGNDQAIFFPRQELAIVKYDDREIYYAVAIPKGEARYVLDRTTGQVDLVVGPLSFLPDPRKQVIAKRGLTEDQVGLWYPGNKAALEYNRKLAAAFGDGEPIYEAATKRDSSMGASSRSRSTGSQEIYAGDEMRRGTTYTPPRTVTLNTKFDGAVTVSVWSGYAVLIVNGSGERRVVIGPTVTFLAYDETLYPLQLSTGTPKTDDNLLRTVYLQTRANKVSDIVDAETADMCKVKIKLSYRVNFEGEPEKWFMVANYVKFMTEHMRSMIRGVVKKHGIEDFSQNVYTILRDVILGEHVEGGDRKGRSFDENGMKIYDVEILNVGMDDRDISSLLTENQINIIKTALSLEQKKRSTEMKLKEEALNREVSAAQTETSLNTLAQQQQVAEKTHLLNLERIQQDSLAATERQKIEQAASESKTELEQEQLQREKARSDQALAEAEEKQKQQMALIKTEVEAFVSRMGSISPNLVAALQAFGDKEILQKVVEGLGPLAVIDRISVQAVLEKLLAGTALPGVLTDITSRMAKRS